MSTCKACGAPIIFIKTVGGKTIPCDAQEVAYIQKAGGSMKIVTPNGEVISAEKPEDPQRLCVQGVHGPEQRVFLSMASPP